VLEGTNLEVISSLRKDISEFKKTVDSCIILWTANTEETIQDIATLEELEAKINSNEVIPASVMYCYAA